MVTFCGSPAASGSPYPAVPYGSRLRYKSPFTGTRFARILGFQPSMEDFAHVLSSHRCMERLRSCAYAGERACGYAPQGNRPECPEGGRYRDPCDKGDELEVPRQSGESSDTPKAPPAPVKKDAPKEAPAPRPATTPGGRAPGYPFTPPVSTPGWTTMPKTGRPEGPERPPAPKQAKADEAAPSSPEPAPASTPPPAPRPPRPAPSLPIDDVIDQGPARHRARRGWFGRRKRYRHIAVLLPLILVAASFAVSFDQRGAHNGEGNGSFTLSISADRPTGGDARQNENENAAMPEDVALMGVQDQLVPRNDAVTPIVPGRPIPRTPAQRPDPEPEPGPDHPIPIPVPTPPGPDPDPVPRIPDPDPIPEPPLPPGPGPLPEPSTPPEPPAPQPPNPLPTTIPVPKPPEPTTKPEPPKPPQTPPGLPLPLPLPTAIPLPPLPLPLPIPLPTQIPLPL